MEKVLFNYNVNPTTWVYLASLIALCVYFKFTRFWSLRNLDLLLLIGISPGVLLVEHTRLLDSDTAGLAQVGYYWLFVVSLLLLIRLLMDSAMVRRPLLEPNLNGPGLACMAACLLVFLMTNVVARDLTPDSLKGSQQLEQMLRLEQRTPQENGLDRYGPGFAVLHAVARLPAQLLVQGETNQEEQGAEKPQLVHAATSRTMALLSHLAIVIGLVLIAQRHFDNVRTGLAVAGLYLLLPYTSHMLGRVDHVLPAALIVWAIMFYRRPVVSGILLGLAAGTIYYPIFLLPLWIGFYWQRGVVRFLLGFFGVVAALLATLVLISHDFSSFLAHLTQTIGWLQLSSVQVKGFWEFAPEVYRIPVLALFAVMAVSFAVWPADKNLGTLLSCSTCVLIGTQFWHAYQGGLCIGWYLPLALLTVFRPNLEDRVANGVLSDSWLPKLKLWKPKVAA